MHNRVRRGEVAEPGLRRTPGTRVDSKGSRGFESPPLRHTVCTIYLQSGDGGKSPRDAGFLRSMRTGESYLGADSLNCRGFSPREEKTGRFTVGADFVHPSPL